MVSRLNLNFSCLTTWPWANSLNISRAHRIGNQKIFEWTAKELASLKGKGLTHNQSFNFWKLSWWLKRRHTQTVIDWMGPPKRYINMALLGKSDFADIIKLRISKWDHSGLPRWVLNAWQTSLQEDLEEEKTQKRKQCEVGNRDPSNGSTHQHQGRPMDTRSWEGGMGWVSLRVSRRNQFCRHPDFGPLASRTMRNKSLLCEPPRLRYSLWQLKQTKTAWQILFPKDSHSYVFLPQDMLFIQGDWCSSHQEGVYVLSNLGRGCRLLIPINRERWMWRYVMPGYRKDIAST